MLECQTGDHKVAGSNLTRDYRVPDPTQHVIPAGSVNEFKQKPGRKQAYHAMHSCRCGWCQAEDWWNDLLCPMGA